uniref:Uncharacterized protein n=1 Tax=Myotis myotis TaxID=51298 RepID=A0A7J7WHU7_MYOMY|nr:hypothetical protein mMyoMyo1_012020 [Myotis myotis]
MAAWMSFCGFLPVPTRPFVQNPVPTLFNRQKKAQLSNARATNAVVHSQSWKVSVLLGFGANIYFHQLSPPCLPRTRESTSKGIGIRILPTRERRSTLLPSPPLASPRLASGMHKRLPPQGLPSTKQPALAASLSSPLPE